MYLDEKLNCNTCILLRNFSNKLLRQALVTISKVFIRPPLGYGDIVYDKPNNEALIKLRKDNMMQHYQSRSKTSMSKLSLQDYLNIYLN